MNTGIENHTFLKETVFLNKNMNLYTHITPFLLKEIYGKLINIHNMLNPCFFRLEHIFSYLRRKTAYPCCNFASESKKYGYLEVKRCLLH